jgi:hypothetical protein
MDQTALGPTAFTRIQWLVHEICGGQEEEEGEKERETGSGDLVITT